MGYGVTKWTKLPLEICLQIQTAESGKSRQCFPVFLFWLYFYVSVIYMHSLPLALHEEFVRKV